MAQTVEQLQMCYSQLTRALEAFLSDSDLVDKCMNDLQSNNNDS